MMVALLHLNGQLRTERYGDRKDVRILLYSSSLLTDEALAGQRDTYWAMSPAGQPDIYSGQPDIYWAMSPAG